MQNAKSLKFILGVIGVIGIIGVLGFIGARRLKKYLNPPVLENELNDISQIYLSE